MSRILAIAAFAATLALGAHDPHTGRHLVCYSYSGMISGEIALYSDTNSGTASAQASVNGLVKTEAMAILTPPSIGTMVWEQGVGLARYLQAKNMFPITQDVVSATWETTDGRQDKLTFKTGDGNRAVFSSTACKTLKPWDNCPLPGTPQHCWDDETCCGTGAESRCCATTTGCDADATQCYSAAAAPSTTEAATPASVPDAPAPTADVNVTVNETTTTDAAGPVTVEVTEYASNATSPEAPPTTTSGMNINVNISAQFPDSANIDVSAASTFKVRFAMALAVIAFALVAFA